MIDMTNVESKRSKFRDEDNHLKKKLLVDDAKDWADKIGKKEVSYTQLRKFYSEVLSIKAKMKEIKDEVECFKRYEAVIGMLISKANYSKIRNKKNEELFNFINEYVPGIGSKQDFDDFVLFFESVLGYYPRRT